MKPRYCPCCTEEISYSSFLKGIVKIHKRNPWIEPEKGFICPKYNKQTLSAERKTILLMPISLVGMIPAWIYIFSLNGNYGIQSIFITLLLFSLLIPIGVLGIYIIYQRVDLICDDTNSDKYNNEMIYV